MKSDKRDERLANVVDPLPIVVIATGTTPKQYLSYLQGKNVSYLIAGKSDLDFKVAFEKIKSKLRVDKLLLEGGGILNGSVLAEDLIDEISLLLTPQVLNHSSAPAVFDRNDEEIDVKKFSLIDIQKLEQDVVWLRYKRFT